MFKFKFFIHSDTYTNVTRGILYKTEFIVDKLIYGGRGEFHWRIAS